MRRDKKEVRSGQEAGFSAEPTRIDMQSSTRSSDETARQTSTGRRIVGVLASGLGRRSSSHYSPTGSPNSPSLLARRQFAFPMLAALAVAALGLSLLLLYNSAFAQATADTYQYPEKGDNPVVVFTASDPEGVSPVVWSVLTDATGIQDIGGDGPVDADGNPTIDADDVADADVADSGLFTVEDGALSFKESPDFETPSGGGVNGTSNTYNVVVQASDGGRTSWVNYFKVTVIRDWTIEETGKVAWTVDPDGDGTAQDPGQDSAGSSRREPSWTASITDLPTTLTAVILLVP